MGCSSSNAANTTTPSDVSGASMKSRLISRIANTDTIKAMSRNAFAAMLNKYPDSKKVFKVPDTSKIDTDLTEAKEARAASDKLFSHYVDIAKTSEDNLDATIRKKAEELNKQGVKAEYVKCYGENLARSTVKDTDNKLTSEEEKIWKEMNNQITNKLTTEMAKLPSTN